MEENGEGNKWRGSWLQPTRKYFVICMLNNPHLGDYQTTLYVGFAFYLMICYFKSLYIAVKFLLYFALSIHFISTITKTRAMHGSPI